MYLVVYVEAPGFPIYEHQENSSCVANDDFHKKQFHGGHSESSECGSTGIMRFFPLFIYTFFKTIFFWLTHIKFSLFTTDESSDPRNTDSSENQDHSSVGDSNENVIEYYIYL